jgi:hypothetical protein
MPPKKDMTKLSRDIDSNTHGQSIHEHGTIHSIPLNGKRITCHCECKQDIIQVSQDMEKVSMSSITW